MEDHKQTYSKDWGSEQPVVFSQGRPLHPDVWEPQTVILAQNGCRTIAHDRRWPGPLWPIRGGPVCLLMSRLYFWTSAERVWGLELTSYGIPSFWEPLGYRNHAGPWLGQRYRETSLLAVPPRRLPWRRAEVVEVETETPRTKSAVFEAL